MSDDIVRRLREDFITNGQCDYCEQWEWRGHFPACPYQSAADEIERLRKENKMLTADLTMAQKWRDNFKLAYERAAGKRKRGEPLKDDKDWESHVRAIVEAVVDEGKFPAFHRKIMRRHRSEWPFLWDRIDKAIQACEDSPGGDGRRMQGNFDRDRESD